MLPPPPLSRSATDRRAAPRTALAPGAYCNTFVGGHPFLAQILDLSPTGVRLRVVGAAPTASPWTPLELGIPGTHRRVFLCAEKVRVAGDEVSYVFAGLEANDRAFLAELVAAASWT